MQNCSNCKQSIEEKFNFCPVCAYPLKANLLTDYETGKISALNSLKKEMLIWFAGLLTVIGISSYFGFSGIDTQIQLAVANEMKSSQESINSAKIKTELMAEKSNATLKIIEGELEKIEKSNKDLYVSLAELNESKERLESLLSEENDQLYFALLKKDFLRLKNIELRISYAYKVKYFDDVIMKNPSIPAVLVSFYTDKVLPLAQFSPNLKKDDLVPLKFVYQNLRGYAVDYPLMKVFRDDLYRKDIEELGKTIITSLDGPKATRAEDISDDRWAEQKKIYLDEYQNSTLGIESLHIAVVVNSNSLYTRVINYPNLSRDKIESYLVESGNSFQLRIPIDLGVDSIPDRYKNLLLSQIND